MVKQARNYKIYSCASKEGIMWQSIRDRADSVTTVSHSGPQLIQINSSSSCFPPSELLRVNYPNPKGKVAPINENNYKGGGGGRRGDTEAGSLVSISDIKITIDHPWLNGTFKLPNYLTHSESYSNIPVAEAKTDNW